MEEVKQAMEVVHSGVCDADQLGLSFMIASKG